MEERASIRPEKLRGRVESALRLMEEMDLIGRLWGKDHSLWKEDISYRDMIVDRLGWLDVIDHMMEKRASIERFAGSVKGEGFGHVLLMGMGGSSLSTEVFHRTYGIAKGYPAFRMLDSTDPEAIAEAESEIDIGRTLFIVSSKSGSTLETLCHFRYFYDRVPSAGLPDPGRRFVAITDPGSDLEVIARETGFREVFLNPQDIGGRYSALSLFGLVPAALMGIDLEELLSRAGRMAIECRSSHPADNPGAVLGAAMAELAKLGRDKLTLVLSPSLEAFGSWAEQLIAESTGKEGVGILPVEGEPLGEVRSYGDDRFFVYMHLRDEVSPGIESKLRDLERNGHPIFEIPLSGKLDLGGEFFRWEFATAVAGALLGINPFDEPNVKESKDNTARVLKEFISSGRMPEGPPRLEGDGITLFCDNTIFGGQGEQSLASALSSFLRLSKPGDYIALMAYVNRSPCYHGLLSEIRVMLRDKLRLAVTLGYGPRFLHSTGQLHKGGPPRGLFIQITSDDPLDIDIPGKGYTFGQLKRAQAIGDLISLQGRGKPAIRIHLRDVSEGLAGLRKALEEALMSV